MTIKIALFLALAAVKRRRNYPLGEKEQSSSFFYVN